MVLKSREKILLVFAIIAIAIGLLIGSIILLRRK